MLRMPAFEVHQPTTAADAVRLRSELPNSLYIAGGTDLLVNLKHQLHRPEHLVSLARVPGLDAIEEAKDGTLRIGARVTLHDIATSELLNAEVPGFALAASMVAGPQHRRMGTIGGNVMLDTRCLFYNQSHEWRTALGNCLKAEGDWCHVIGSPKGCVAAQSSDTVPNLVALDARIAVLEPDGVEREVNLRELFTKDGRFDQIHTVPQTSLVTAIVIPPREMGHRSTYRKLRSRGAIDYPQLGVAVVVALDKSGCLAQIEACIGAMLPQPKRLTKLDGWLGRPLTDEVIAELGERAFKQVRPQPNIHGDPAWRRHMARVEFERALQSLRD